jgi:tRNA A-37 threonylcarbamoyl transferase component Bud32/cell division septation protein DedD
MTNQQPDHGPTGRTPQPGATMANPIAILPDGTQPVPLGSGVITCVLGEGGAAIVYEVWNAQLGVKRAVKVLRPNAMPSSFERFTTEMRITAQLRHPNVIEIHSVGEWNRLPYIEMERLDGASLDKLIEKHGALPPVVVIAIAIMIARALKYTHNHDYVINDTRYRGILHRDLKPANVMISESGMVKLMDFGIATPTEASMHTMEGTFVGSLQYLAPEQLEGKKASTSSDLYALGAVMYEMLTGQQAFSERNMTKLISMRLKNEYKPLGDSKARVPAKLVKLVNACMAWDREKRCSDAAQVQTELERIYSGLTRYKPEEAVEAFFSARAGARRTVVFRRRFPVVRAGVSAAALGLVAFGGYEAWLHRDDLQSLTRTITSAPDTVSIRTAVVETVTVTKYQQAPTPVRAPARVETLMVARPESDARRHTQAVAPRQTPAPQAAPVTPRKVDKSFLVLLAEKYGTEDLLAILSLELGQRNYASALRVYDSLSADQRAGKRALLYRMRALQGVGSADRLAEFFEKTRIADSEYYLGRAQYLYSVRRYREALAALDNCGTSQAEFMDARTIEREVVYYKAMCLTGIYATDQTEQNRSAAAESWFNVKYAFRNDQNHRYFKYANEQIRRMTPSSEEGK